MKSNIKKTNDNMFLDLYKYKGILGIFEIVDRKNSKVVTGDGEMFRQFTGLTNDKRIDSINEIYGLELTAKKKKLLKRGSLQYEDDKTEKSNILYDIFNKIYDTEIQYNDIIEKGLKNSEKFDYNEIMHLLRQISDIKYLDKTKVEKNAKRIEAICNKYNLNNDIYDIERLTLFVKEINKIIDNDMFINIYIKKMMYKMGYRIEKYKYIGMVILTRKIDEMTTEEIIGGILRYYIKGYNEFFNDFDINDLVDRKNGAYKIIEKYFKKNKERYILRSDIEENVTLSEVTIKRALIQLQKNKIIERYGANKNSKYKYIGG